MVSLVEICSGGYLIAYQPRSLLLFVKSFQDTAWTPIDIYLGQFCKKKLYYVLMNTAILECNLRNGQLKIRL